MNLIQNLKNTPHSLNILSTHKGSTDTPGITILKRGEREFQRFFYIIRGTASFEISSGETVVASEGALVYLPCDCTYVCSWNDCKRCEFISVNFVISNKNNEEINLGNEICIAATDKDLTYFEMLNKLHASWIENNYFCLLGSFYEFLGRVYSDAHAINKTSRIHKALLYIENHYCDDTPIGELARMCGICPTEFRILFKKETGYSPVKYKNHLKLQKSLSMLEYDDYSISEIADILNFSDVYYFTKLFKKEFAITPAKYKKRTFNR